MQTVHLQCMPLFAPLFSVIASHTALWSDRDTDRSNRSKIIALHTHQKQLVGTVGVCSSVND